MARAKRSTTVPQSTVYTQFLALLKKAGCVYCSECRAYMFPDHREHCGALAVDRHASHVAVVGSFGNVRVVDLRESAAPVAADYLSDTPMVLDSELAEVA